MPFSWSSRSSAAAIRRKYRDRSCVRCHSICDKFSPTERGNAVFASRKQATSRRIVSAGMFTPIGVVTGGGAQQRIPLAGIDIRIARIRLRRQRVKPRVQQARGLVGSLQIPADHVKVPGLVAIERALGDAGMRLRAFLQHRADRGEMVRRRSFRRSAPGFGRGIR